jgi:hypothetical protein
LIQSSSVALLRTSTCSASIALAIEERRDHPRARGDETPQSDTDLLLVSAEETPPLHTGMGPVSLSTYSLADLTRRAEDGDLFLWHCLYEGKAIHDPERVFDRLRAGFRLKHSYGREVGQGTAVAWLLVMFGAVS